MIRFHSTNPGKWQFSTRSLALCVLSLGVGCGSSSADSPGDAGPVDDSSGGAQRSVLDGGLATPASALDASTGALDGSASAAKVDSGGGASTGAVSLGTAANYVMLAKSAMTTVPTSAITGNLGLSPAAATFITGFSLTADSTNVFSTSPQVTGKVYASDYSAPTPSDLTTAIGDMEQAFTDAAGRAPDVTELGAGNIGGKTLGPGVYKWGTGLLIPTDLTLAGSATDVWIFQIAQDLMVSSGSRVLLSGGAAPKNVFWQVAGLVDVGTTAHLEGVVLTQTSVALKTGASITGRLMAQTAVTIDSAVVRAP